MVAAVQPRLFSGLLAAVEPISIDELNLLLCEWGHRMGALNRPFRNEGWALVIDGRPVSVASSSSIVAGPVAGYRIQEVVELSRLCAEPGNRWANRVMLRLWREVCAPRYEAWPVKAAVSYSHNAMHAGDIYRTDGWTKVRHDAGSNGGTSWGAKRKKGDPLYGTKSLWLWRYEANPNLSSTLEVD